MSTLIIATDAYLTARAAYWRACQALRHADQGGVAHEAWERAYAALRAAETAAGVKH